MFNAKKEKEIRILVSDSCDRNDEKTVLSIVYKKEEQNKILILIDEKGRCEQKILNEESDFDTYSFLDCNQGDSFISHSCDLSYKI